MEKKKIFNMVTTKDLEQELYREKYKCRYKKILKNTVYTLLIVVAISIICATFIFPVLHIYGDSMNPNLTEGNIVICVHKTRIKSGDIIAFYHQNKILVKRVIAHSYDWVNIDESGNVYVNDKLLEEKYLEEKILGESDIKYPYQVPEDSYFVLGDKRENSLDSRQSLIGTISQEDIIGKIVFRVWPLNQFGIPK